MKRVLLLAVLISALGLVMTGQSWGTPARQTFESADLERGGGDDDEPFKTGRALPAVPMDQPRSGDMQDQAAISKNSDTSIATWKTTARVWLQSLTQLMSRLR